MRLRNSWEVLFCCLSKIRQKEMEYGYENAGIALTLGGRPSTPRELARLCVIREKGCYMGDYIQDEKGKLKEIRFDKVKES